MENKFSFEKAAKFKDEDKFFDVNYLWVPGLKWAVEKLYYTSVRPEVLVFLSLVSGFISAYFFAQQSYLLSIVAVVFIQIKNFLDTVDGYLARARGQVSRLGRFLDSLADALVYVCLFTAIGMNLSPTLGVFKAYGLAYTAMISAFLQCSFYNYYLVSYKTFIYGEGANRTDESFRKDEHLAGRWSLSEIFLYLLQCIYHLVYGWQDRIVSMIDTTLIEKAENENRQETSELHEIWYTDKRFLALVSPLCFGTQILLLSLFTLFGNVANFLWFIIVVWNLYALGLLLGRTALVRWRVMPRE